jgi:apolipoprotein N-acyltransferase
VGCYDIIEENNKRFKVNSAVHYDPLKGLGKRYDKQILVPFGEYMPFEKQLDFIYRQIRWKSRFLPGKGPVVQQLDGIPYGFLICYEAIFPSLVRKSVQEGAELLVNITYDAWYGRTSAPHQHLLLAAVRSAEHGIPLIRLGTTGFSTVIDSLGRMGDKSNLFEQEVLLHTVKLVHLPSLYTRIGNAFAWLCVLIFGFGLVFLIKKKI